MATEALPTAFDYETPNPPSGGTFWVRRLPNENVWTAFLFDDERIVVALVLASPPYPIARLRLVARRG